MMLPGALASLDSNVAERIREDFKCSSPPKQGCLAQAQLGVCDVSRSTDILVGRISAVEVEWHRE